MVLPSSPRLVVPDVMEKWQPRRRDKSKQKETFRTLCDAVPMEAVKDAKSSSKGRYEPVNTTITAVRSCSPLISKAVRSGLSLTEEPGRGKGLAITEDNYELAELTAPGSPRRTARGREHDYTSVRSASMVDRSNLKLTNSSEVLYTLRKQEAEVANLMHKLKGSREEEREHSYEVVKGKGQTRFLVNLALGLEEFGMLNLLVLIGMRAGKPKR